MTFEIFMSDLGIWIAAILTLAVFSFLYKDNPVYKLAEHLFVGVAAGYTIAKAFWEVFVPNFYRQLMSLTDGSYPEGRFFWILGLLIPGFLGFLFFFRFHPKSAWLSRWSIAFLVGAYAGVNLTGYFQGDLVIQAQATFVNLRPGHYEAGTWMVVGKQLPIVLGVLATLTYFFFSKPHTGFIGVTARTGIFFLMAAFGASFGYTVMARISLFIGRIQFLFGDWLGIVS